MQTPTKTNAENSVIIPPAWKSHDDKVRPYARKHRVLTWSKNALGLGLVAYLVWGGGGGNLQNAIANLGSAPVVTLLLFFAVIGLGWEVATLPFAFAGYRVERKFGLSKQSPKSWFADQMKGLGLGAVFGGLGLALIHATVIWLGSLWWLGCAIGFTFISIGLAQLAPVLLIPLFFKMEPMAASPLKDRLLSLCARFQIQVKEVYRLGLGEKTEKGNAAFMGLGRTKRIVIGDTIYEKYLPEEVEAVFAHELGHQVHNDLWKGIGISTVTLFATFWLSDALLRNFAYRYFPATPGEPMGLLIFFLVLSVIQFPVGVAQAAHSRWREREADEFAATTTKVAAPLADALEKLTYQNWGYFKPHGLTEFLFYSHPAPWRRITKLRRGA